MPSGLKALWHPENSPPELHKAQAWALWHGFRLPAGSMASMNRAERFRALDQLTETLDRADAPPTILLWQADLYNRRRKAPGTAWLTAAEIEHRTGGPYGQRPPEKRTVVPDRPAAKPAPQAEPEPEPEPDDWPEPEPGPGGAAGWLEEAPGQHAGALSGPGTSSGDEYEEPW